VNYPSLLTREESGAIKGVLILLIVLGHNSLIMDATGLFPYLYSFHVYCFYILPFMYGVPDIPENGRLKFIIRRSWHNIRRFYPLYILWSIIGATVGVCSGKIVFSPWGAVRAVALGNQTFLAEYCGFALLWFLPTIVAVMFWRDVYFCSGKTGGWMMFLISTGLWVLSACGFTNFHAAGELVPLAFVQGLFFTASGIAVRMVLRRIRSTAWTGIAALPLFCAALSFVRWRGYLPAACTWLTWIIVPTAVFISLYRFRYFFGKVGILKFVGRYSLQIYLLHSFIFNVMLRLTPWKNVIAGISIFIISVAMSIGVALAVERSAFKRILFAG